MGVLGMVSVAKAFKASPAFTEQKRGVYMALCKHRDRAQRLASELSNVYSDCFSRL